MELPAAKLLIGGGNGGGFLGFLFCQFLKVLDFMSSSGLQLSLRSVAHWKSETASGHLSQETRVVTKKEIVKAISEEIGLTQLKTKEIVQKTFDAIVETLVRESRIELRNFGVFEVKKRAARKARNPRTGERVDVAAKYVVTFKPGKEMEEKVRELEEREAQEAALKAQEAQQRKTEAKAPPTGAAPSASDGSPSQPSGNLAADQSAASSQPSSQYRS